MLVDLYHRLQPPKIYHQDELLASNVYNLYVLLVFPKSQKSLSDCDKQLVKIEWSSSKALKIL